MDLQPQRAVKVGFIPCSHVSLKLQRCQLSKCCLLKHVFSIFCTLVSSLFNNFVLDPSAKPPLPTFHCRSVLTCISLTLCVADIIRCVRLVKMALQVVSGNRLARGRRRTLGLRCILWAGTQACSRRARFRMRKVSKTSRLIPQTPAPPSAAPISTLNLVSNAACTAIISPPAAPAHAIEFGRSWSF